MTNGKITKKLQYGFISQPKTVSPSNYVTHLV